MVTFNCFQIIFSSSYLSRTSIVYWLTFVGLVRKSNSHLFCSFRYFLYCGILCSNLFGKYCSNFQIFIAVLSVIVWWWLMSCSYRLVLYFHLHKISSCASIVLFQHLLSQWYFLMFFTCFPFLLFATLFRDCLDDCLFTSRTLNDRSTTLILPFVLTTQHLTVLTW